MVVGCLFVIGNGTHYQRFIRDGRGHPSESLAMIARETPSGPLSISTNTLWRTQLLLSFYAPRLRPHRDIDFHDVGGDWLILIRIHATSADAETDFHGDHYRLKSADHESELSAWSWFLYRRV
jgi:hypothetical protein